MSELPPSTAITQLLDGFFAAHVVMASTRLKLYTKCADQPQDADTLAHRCEVEPAWMTLLLDANVALGLLEATPDGFAPTPVARAYLNEQKHGALTNTLKFALDAEAPHWLTLADVIRGRNARPDFGADERNDPGAARAYGKAGFNLFFNDAMRCGAFHDVSHAVELGNGLGPLGMAVLRQSARARLTLVDWPSYERPLFKTLRHAGYRERTRFVGGDPVDAAPRDGAADLVLMAGVLSRSALERRRGLLRAAAAALQPGGRLHVQDYVADQAHAAAEALARLRAAMLFGPHNLAPLRPDAVLDLLHEAGFVDAVLLPIPDSAATCVTARKKG